MNSLILYMYTYDKHIPLLYTQLPDIQLHSHTSQHTSTSKKTPKNKPTNLMATTPCLPVPNATIPFWRTNLDPLDSHRSTEELPSHCDILVIGAGYAGASTVHHILKQQTSPLKILLLEAREACSGASGRNGKYLVKKTSYLKNHLHAKKKKKEKQFSYIYLTHILQAATSNPTCTTTS